MPTEMIHDAATPRKCPAQTCTLVRLTLNQQTTIKSHDF